MHASNTKEKPNEQDIKKVHAAPHAGAAGLKRNDSIPTLQITATSRPTPGRLASSQLLGADLNNSPLQTGKHPKTGFLGEDCWN